APGLLIGFDRSHFHRVMSNLLMNASRYSSGRPGAIRLTARALPERMVEIAVIDDGAGISVALRAQVFEPFFTTHAGGTGLGLYIARELCEANGASLDLRDSDPGAHFCMHAQGELWTYVRKSPTARAGACWLSMTRPISASCSI